MRTATVLMVALALAAPGGAGPRSAVAEPAAAELAPPLSDAQRAALDAMCARRAERMRAAGRDVPAGTTPEVGVTHVVTLLARSLPHRPMWPVLRGRDAYRMVHLVALES